MKKFLSILIILSVSSVFLFSESYKIVDISYKMKGLTRQYALSQNVPVDTETVFENYEEFDKYITDLKQQLTNQRVFQSSDVTVTLLEENEEGFIPVNIIITTTDTLNIIAVPYPSYNSNSGITLKIKVKDYNFLGSMETMDFDLNYQAKGTDDLEDVTHVYGMNFGFSVPFNFVSIPASWNNSFSFEYTVGNPQMDMAICEGISFSIPVSNITSANISLNQYFYQKSNNTYVTHHDDKYFQDVIKLALPFTIARIPDFSNISWTPSVSFSYNWDFDVFNHVPNGGIEYSGLRGPTLSFGHSISTGRINWLGNFRDGLSASLSQSFSYNLYDSSESMSMTFSSQYHKKLSSFIGLSTREYWYKNFYNSNTCPGSMIRGIRDISRDIKSSDFLLLNIDVPFKLFQTNWGKLFGWDKLNFFNFEFQFSPFQDIVLGVNPWTDTKYSLKDGWYGTGFEMLVFPDRFRSIQGRISFGVDSVLFLKKVGNHVDAFNGMADKLFNTGWRSSHSSGWYELSIGIGLFY